jgi:hypothetical protein
VLSAIARDSCSSIAFDIPANHFQWFPYIDLLNGLVTVEILCGKIVLIAATASGLIGDDTLPPMGAISAMVRNAYILQGRSNLLDSVRIYIDEHRQTKTLKLKPGYHSLQQLCL